LPGSFSRPAGRRFSTFNQEGGMSTIDSLIEKHGGDLKQLVKKFEDAGLGDRIKSWIGTGENKPVSADEVKQALGPDEVKQLADQDGIDPDQAAQSLANDLPVAVDKVTPDGSIPSVDEVKKALTGLIR
jgi:uncharacterized protein YidB (DUF937 family)